MAIQWDRRVPIVDIRDTYRSQVEDVKDAFQPEAGPTIDAPSYSAAVERHQFEMQMTREQYGYFKEWYRETLKLGALQFEREHPLDRTNIATFTLDNAPSISRMVGKDEVRVPVVLVEVPV